MLSLPAITNHCIPSKKIVASSYSSPAALSVPAIYGKRNRLTCWHRAFTMKVMSTVPENLSYMERQWESGQRHLVAGRYVAARSDLQAAEAIAWREKDFRSLARLYLPLLEARRQIRYNAAEGAVVICPPGLSQTAEQRALRNFLRADSGTILLGCAAGCGPAGACRLAESVQYASRRTGRWLEALLLIDHGGEVRLSTQADPTFAAGLPVEWTSDPKRMIGASTDGHLIVPLPPAGTYRAGDPLHAVARESLIVAWEALALKWQHRHPLRKNAQPWDEIAWLRRALRIDPACEPISMRLMSLVELMERSA
jgi:hypothetical protein